MDNKRETVELELLFPPNGSTIGRLTLSECIGTDEPCVALCLRGIHESPEVYLTEDDADRMTMALMRFITSRNTTPEEERARAARLGEWLQRDGYAIAHAAAEKSKAFEDARVAMLVRVAAMTVGGLYVTLPPGEDEEYRGKLLEMLQDPAFWASVLHGFDRAKAGERLEFVKDGS